MLKLKTYTRKQLLVTPDLQEPKRSRTTLIAECWDLGEAGGLQYKSLHRHPIMPPKKTPALMQEGLNPKPYTLNPKSLPVKLSRQ